MKVTYFVNTMMMLESKASRVLCDPWVSFGNESQSGLYNFPEPVWTKDDIAALKPDFIYITHTHGDHYDPPTLALFDRNTPILVSWYENNFTERAMRKLGFTDVRVCDPVKGMPLNGDDHVWIEPSAVYPDVDSVAIFKMDGVTFVNANDNPFDDKQFTSIRERLGPIDAAALPIGYYGPYPMFYENLNAEEKAAAARKKELNNYVTIAQFAKALQPRWMVPVAGGAVYGGPKALMLKYSGVGTIQGVADQLAAEGLATEVVRMSQNNSIDLKTGERHGAYVERTHKSEWAYIERIAQKASPFDEGGLFWIDPSQRIDLMKLLVPARAKQKSWQDKMGVVSDAVFFVDVGFEHLYRFSLDSLEVTKVREAEIADAAYEIFRIPYPLMIGLLTEHYNFSNVKTQHASFFRKPDVFNPQLHLLMSHLHV